MLRPIITATMCLATIVALGRQAAVSAEVADPRIDEARASLAQGDARRAAGLAGEVLADDAKNRAAFAVRAAAYDVLEDYDRSVADWSRVIDLDPRAAEAFDRRGSAHFKLGHIGPAIADFDRFIQLRPAAAAGHWRRGIAYYYAKRFDEGRRQFEAYQSVDNNDVENAVWQNLCIAAADGVPAARKRMMRVGQDRRVPMMMIDALFRGKATPDQVVSAATAGRPSPERLQRRLFYAHLYLGLYYESLGETTKSLAHIKKAVHQYKVKGYMWEVARVHESLRAAAGGDRKAVKPAK